MDGRASFVLCCSFTRTKITNPGITLQMDICTWPCVFLADLVENSRYSKREDAPN